MHPLSTQPIIVTDNFLPYFIDCLSNASRYFYMSSYLASPPKKGLGKKFCSTWNTIYTTIQRGVDFRLIVDSGLESAMIRNSLSNIFNFPFPVPIKIRALSQGQKLHAKFFITDDTIVYSGSHNFTKRGFQNPFEFGFIIYNNELSIKTKIYFMTLWDLSNESLSSRSTG
jgi:phosphatidylserine/phosphatidylglycerophosphate/cardiolipin synthase-like enzyme